MCSEGIPVVSVANLSDPQTLAALDAACRDWGFFQVVDHGIEPVVTNALQRQMRAFFAQPAVEAFYAACERLAFRLLAALSVNLGMPAGHLARSFQPAQIRPLCGRTEMNSLECLLHQWGEMGDRLGQELFDS